MADDCLSQNKFLHQFLDIKLVQDVFVHMAHRNIIQTNLDNVWKGLILLFNTVTIVVSKSIGVLNF